MADKRPALGKGLSALIPDAPGPSPVGLNEVDIDRLEPNPQQPRQHMDETALEDLAGSIRAQGVMQPILVRPVNGRYQIIAGERRWRAAQRAGLLRVPVVVREVPGGDEQALLVMALVENLQREDLNPLEEAWAYRRLADQFHLTQEEVAAIVGKDRSSVANTLRLLKLPEEVRQLVADGRLSMGHARALLALEDQAVLRKTAMAVVTRGDSVRQLEGLVRRLLAPPKPEPRADVHTRTAEEKMRLALGTRVHIVRRGKGGSVRIDFKTEDDLQRVYERITGEE
jgi:ParB family chromosome partitioning protein